MAEPGADELVGRPPSGRTFTATRRVRFGDLDPRGRLRLDALARYLQDISGDDTDDAGLDNVAWVVRRTKVVVERSPRFREWLTMTTFCSGLGGRWAERRVTLEGDRGGRIEAVSLWIHLDGATGRAVPMPEAFHEHYDESAGGRTVSARLRHEVDVPSGARRWPWVLRAADYDLLGHVNNAATWAAVEEALADAPPARQPWQAELEYRLAIEPGARVELAEDRPEGWSDDGTLRLWMVDPDDPAVLYATAQVRSTHH